jgi:sterol-4alpha-carboxylate 3-dehydrogenase (decarboxylating)
MNKGHATFNNCLVIGGAGMLGHEIARQLLGEGCSVRIMDLRPAEVDGVEEIIGDVRDPRAVSGAVQGMDVVFHAAAAVWNRSTPPRTYDEVNVGGTANVIEACRAAGVASLVYTSTMDVVVDGARPIVDGDEGLPYPRKVPADNYSRTKIVAERMVIAANDNGLATCALRPAGIYGPRDRYHLPGVLDAAKKGMPFRLGTGQARFSHVYSENAAHAHVLAARHCCPLSPVAGQCYFITDHHPATNLFDFMEPFVRALGYELPRRRIPYGAAYVLAWINEKINPLSNFNRFSVVQTCVDHTFVHHRAARDFGYAPRVSLDEAFRRTVQWFEHQGFAGKNQLL